MISTFWQNIPKIQGEEMPSLVPAHDRHSQFIYIGNRNSDALEKLHWPRMLSAQSLRRMIGIKEKVKFLISPPNSSC